MGPVTYNYSPIRIFDFNCGYVDETNLMKINVMLFIIPGELGMCSFVSVGPSKCPYAMRCTSFSDNCIISLNLTFSQIKSCI